MPHATETLPRELGAAVTDRVSRLRRVWSSRATEDPATQRWRRIFVSLGRALCYRAIAMGCTVAMIPLAIGYLGAERYGLWVTLAGFVNMLSFFDFGIGVGLQNRVAEMMGKGELHLAAPALRSAALVVLAIASALFGFFALVVLGTDWVTSAASGTAFAQIDLRSALLIIVGAFLLGLPLSLLSRMAFGLQQGWIASLSATVGTVLSLIAVATASALSIGFTAFIAVTVAPPILAQAASLFLLNGHTPGGLTLLGPVSLRDGASTLRKGSAFILPQIVGVIVTQGPLVLLGVLSSPVNAAIYSVFTRISLPFQQLQQMFLDQVWPAITEAQHRGDMPWLRATLRRILKSTLLFSTAAGLVVAVGIYYLFPILTKSSGLAPDTSLILLYAGQMASMAMLQGFVYMANGLSRTRHQNYFAAICLVYVATLLPMATRHSGLQGMLLASFALHVVVALPLFYRDYARHLKETASS